MRDWLEDRYAVFLARYEARLADLEKVIEACEARGLRVALLEMPLNLPVDRRRLRRGARDLPQARVSSSPTSTASSTSASSPAIGLQNKDFHDLQHLLPSGRSKWQARLSRELVRNRTSSDALGRRPAARPAEQLLTAASAAATTRRSSSRTSSASGSGR